MNPSSVALVIRCFNEEAHIGRLLTGVMRQTRRPDQIVVVDSGSTDATVAIASAFPVDVLSIAPEEFSFGRALNRGFAATDAEVVVLASAHVYPVYDTWIELLVAPFAVPEVAATYGRQQAPSDGRLSERQILERWFPSVSEPRQGHPFCNNANAAVRRRAWEGRPYDEALTGLEDLDWATKAQAAGQDISYVAEAPVVHVHDESFSQIVNRYRREAIAYKAIRRESRMSLPTAIRLGLANVLGDLREAQREGSLRGNAAGIFAFRTAQFYGTYRGFAQQGATSDILRRRFYYPSSPSGPQPTPPSDAPGRVIDYEEPSRGGGSSAQRVGLPDS